MKIIKQYLEEIGLVGAGLLGAGAVYLYRRMMSDAARACNQFYGINKTICMLKYKIRIAQTMLSKATTSNEKQMWKARLEKYRYKLVMAQRKLAAEKRQTKK